MTDPLPELPPPAGTPYRIALVCLGNICRSPMADVVLTALLERAGLAARVEVTSAGTAGWHVGNPMDSRAAACLRGEGYDPSTHRASQLDAGWFDRDLVLVMDETNLADVRALGPGSTPVRLFRDFDPVGPGAVPDPYDGTPEDYAEVFTMVHRTAVALVDRLEGLLRR